MKKILTLFLTFTLMFSLAVPSFAAEKVSLNGTYKIVSFDVNSSITSGWNEKVSGSITKGSYSSTVNSFTMAKDSITIWTYDACIYIYPDKVPDIIVVFENQSVSSLFYDWLIANSIWLDAPEPEPEPEPETPSTETIVVKEDRPFFETSLLDYTVTEGLLLLLFVTTFLNNIFKQHLKGN